MIERGLQPPVDRVKRHSALDLDQVLIYCGIPTEPIPHNALTGALVETESFGRLFYGKPYLPEFGKFPMPKR